MQAYAYSHIGSVRKKNEDALFCDADLGLFIVADGIGGRLAGEVASSMAINIAVETVKSESDENPLTVLKEAFYRANDALFRGGKEKEHLGMGSTMTAVLIRKDRLYWAHVGDSRAYLINEEGIEQLTQDHSLVGELLREGTISEDEAEHHPQKNILIRSLGQESLVKVDSGEVSWQTGHYLLICSDGLYNLIDKEKIQQMVCGSTDLSLTTKQMVEAALAAGGFDNISIVLVHLQGEGNK
ncbi:MAG: Stp1/IreP family PP2C-type Ser/Thr phosphatase [Bacillota bacterium]|jgi:serine/threonine protein phosphatase PrpC